MENLRFKGDKRLNLGLQYIVYGLIVFDWLSYLISDSRKMVIKSPRFSGCVGYAEAKVMSVVDLLH